MHYALCIVHRPSALPKLLPSALKRDHARERAARAPNTTAEARELDDLRVVDEEVRACSLVLDVIREHVRFGRLEPGGRTNVSRLRLYVRMGAEDARELRT